MKKLSFLLIALLVLLVGCSTKKNVSVGAEKANGYVFEAKNNTIAMHAKIAPILKSLGKSKEYFEAPSCAFKGLEKNYTYNGFELHTYELSGVDYVASIVFLDDSVSTKEGIALNSDLKDVLKLYGNKYTKKSNSYTYLLDKSKISFIIENNKVTSIEYIAFTE